MLDYNYIAELLKSKDIILLPDNWKRKGSRTAHKSGQKPHKCPRCGNITSKIHDYRTQRVKDIPMMEQEIVVKVLWRTYNRAERRIRSNVLV